MNTRTNSTGLAVAETATRERTTLGRLKTLLPSLAPELGDPVQIAIPSDTAWSDPTQREALMSGTPEAKAKRRNMLASIRSLLELHEEARAGSRALSDVAMECGERCRAALHKNAVALFAANREREIPLRAVALFFSNLQGSAEALKRKIHAINATPREIASGAGLKRLAAILSNEYCRPDSRGSYGFVQVCGFPGSPEALRRLARTVEKYRGVLVTDAPDSPDRESLAAAADVGGMLEEIPGAEVYHRRTIVFGNTVRARHAYAGKDACEAEDLMVPASGPWLGSYMDNVVQGFPWRPATGYGRPIEGVDGVKHDLLLAEEDGYLSYLKHHINPCIRLSAASDLCVVWGVDTLSNVKGGIQIGVSVVENKLIRYAEWLMKKEVIFDEKGLEAAEQKLSSMLRQFMEVNTGAGLMFRSGSSFSVRADYETKSLQVAFELLYQEVAETATITVMKKSKNDPGEVAISSD
jgi:hypothetical protein